MRRLGHLFQFLIVAALLLVPASAAAQYARFDFPEYTINQSAPIPGGMYPMLAFPGVAVQLCSTWNSSACTALLQTYQTAAGTACPTSAQLVSPQPGSTCSNATDATGDLGGFAAPGNYAYFVTTAQGTYGPYLFGVDAAGAYCTLVTGCYAYFPGADPTGNTDNSSIVNSFIANQLPTSLQPQDQVNIPPGTFYTPNLINRYGYQFLGPGSLLGQINQTSQNSVPANVTATKGQTNTYACPPGQIICGIENTVAWAAAQGNNFLSAIRTTTLVGFSGDSTTSGVNVAGRALVDQMFAYDAQANGIPAVTTANYGHSGQATTQWLASYLASDQGNNPTVYVVRWGINDPTVPNTVAQTIQNIRIGLNCIRNGTGASGVLAGDTCTPTGISAHSVDAETVILEMPSSTNDNPNGRGPAFYEQLRNGYLQAARDYHAVFIDLYVYQQDVSSQGVGVCMMSRDYAFPITNVSISGNVATLTATNFATVGMTVSFSNLVSATFLNGQTATVLSAGLSGSQFEVSFTHSNYSASDTGYADPSNPSIRVHPGNCKNPSYEVPLSDVLIRPWKWLSNTVTANVPNADSSPLQSLNPSSYGQMISLYRATVANGWPVEGQVITWHQTDGVWLQIDSPLNGSLGYASRSSSSSSTWGCWNFVGMLPTSFPPCAGNFYFGPTSGGPDAMWVNLSAGTNQTIYDAFNDVNGVLHLRAVNDANNASNDWATVTRSGATPINLALPEPVGATSYQGKGTASFASGAGAGTSPGTPTCATTCDSVQGIVNMVTGTGPPTSGTILTVTTGITRGHAPACALSITSGTTGARFAPFNDINTTTTQVIFALAGSALSASTTYVFQYICMGQ